MKRNVQMSLIIMLMVFMANPSYGESTGDKKVFINYLAGYAAGSDGQVWADGTVREPSIGFYSSQSWSAHLYHILLSSSCGVDGMVVNIRNEYDETSLAQIKSSIERITEVDASFDYALGISYTDAGKDQTQVESELTDLNTDIIAGNTNYLQKDGEPVVFWWNGGSLSSAQFRSAVSNVFTSGSPVVLRNEIDLGLTSGGTIDSFYPWVQGFASDGTNWGEGYLDWFYGTSADKVANSITDFVSAAVYPGFDDRQVSWGQNRWIDRSSGATYNNTWNKVHGFAGSSPIEWVFLQTWNGFNEGTEIEPTVEFGFDYVISTATNISTYKGETFELTTAMQTASLKLYEAAALIESGTRDYDAFYPLLQSAIQEYLDGNATEATAYLNQIIDVVEWTGAVDGSWSNSANWADNALPTSGDNILVGAADNALVIREVIEVDNVTVLNGEVIQILPEAGLKITGDFNGSGEIQTSRNLAGSDQYNLVGVPIENTSISSLAPDHIYDYNGTSYEVPLGTIDPGKGYFMAYSADQVDLSLQGVPNTGDISTLVSTSGDAINIVANPYLAALDRSAFISANSSAIDGNIWFWNDGGTNAGSKRGGDYFLVNNMGVVSTVDLSDGVSGLKNAPTENTPIGTFQGFLVKATSDTDVVFEPDMQVATSGSNDDDTYFRSESEIQKIKLSLSGMGYMNQIIVGFTEGATFGHDFALDAPKLFSGSEFSFHTLIGNEPHVIQALPKSDDELRLPLVINVSESGTYGLRVEDFQQLSYMNVSLEDALTNKTYSLESGAIINLVLNSGEYTDRFYLNFSKSAALGLQAKPVQLEVYKTSGAIQVVSDTDGSEYVTIHDITGKTYYKGMVFFSEGRASIALELSDDHIYVIRLGSGSTRKFAFK